MRPHATTDMLVRESLLARPTRESFPARYLNTFSQADPFSGPSGFGKRLRLNLKHRGAIAELAVAAEQRKSRRDRNHNNDGANTTGNHRDRRIKEMRDQAGFETAELVGRTDEQAVDRRDA